jgi:sulfur carrier protein
MVTVDVVGGETHEVALADLPTDDPTYADLLSVTEYSHHEVSIMIEGTPVPEDQSVDADHVRVLRLVAGG